MAINRSRMVYKKRFFSRRAFFQNLILFACAVIGTLFVAELLAAGFSRANKLEEKLETRKAGQPKISSVDKDLGWGFVPYSRAQHVTSDFTVEYSINSKGHRDKESPVNKPAGIFRIVALGDSMVFGQGVDYGMRFTEVIENSLEKVEVINMGVWGYGADQSLVQLERDGFGFLPDAVILFTINDDFNRCSNAYNASSVTKPYFVINPQKTGLILQGISPATEANKKSGSPKKQPAVKETNTSLMAGSKLALLFNYRKKLQELDRNGRLEKEQRQRRENLAAGRSPDASRDEDLRKLIPFILARYSAECLGHGADFIVAHIDVGDPLHLKEICRELRITYLDMSETLSHASKMRSLKFAIDPHYTASTHAVIGEYVSAYIAVKYGLKRYKK